MSGGLSFRERAAIALYAAPGDETGRYTKEGAVSTAQALADECCKQWGHDQDLVVHLGAADRCRRCGKELSP